MYRLIDKLEQEQIKSFYLKGKSIKYIAAYLNRDPQTISRWLDKLGLNKRTQSEIQRKLKYNENYFNKIDTEIKAYLLGFIYADGCNNGRGLTIAINKKDISILELIIKELNSNLTIKERKNDIVELAIFNKQIEKDLTKWGVIKTKMF